MQEILYGAVDTEEEAEPDYTLLAAVNETPRVSTRNRQGLRTEELEEEEVDSDVEEREEEDENETKRSSGSATNS